MDPQNTSGQEQSSTPGEEQSLSARSAKQDVMRKPGRVKIEIRAEFELDDASIFDLNGEGLTITAVTSN